MLLKCLKQAGYFGKGTEAATQQGLSPDELFIGRLLYHFQNGIQYNLHSVYQVRSLKEVRCGF